MLQTYAPITNYFGLYRSMVKMGRTFFLKNAIVFYDQNYKGVGTVFGAPPWCDKV